MSQRPPQAEEAKFLDPIALSLVLWLGSMVGALGVQRLVDQAAQQQTAVLARTTPVQTVPVVWRR